MNNLQIAEIDKAIEEQNLSLALSKVQAFIQEQPENVKGFILFGDLFRKMSNFPMAVEKYQHALHIEPINAEIYCRLGEAYAAQEMWDLANSNFKSASSIEPQNLHYLSLHGWSQWHLGKGKNNKPMQEEAAQLLLSVYEQGVRNPLVKEVLAERFIDNATATWPFSVEENRAFATRIEHLQEARESLNQAGQMLDDLSSPLQQELHRVRAEVDHQEQREFYGYPYMRRAPIVAGVIFLIVGKTGLAFFLFLLAALYHFSQFKPGYLANRKYIKGNYNDPFWVRRINGVGEFFSQFSFFGSLGQVFLWSWLFNLLAKVIQYTMAIFILPFLIASGFVVNYDLYNKTKTWVASQRQTP